MLACLFALAQVQVSSLFVAGWAGLVVNSLNLLPTGELDGGRIALACFGRRCGYCVIVMLLYSVVLLRGICWAVIGMCGCIALACFGRR